mmetsp:Transcript_68716/g.173724  ORF Transcript_68716/g.173724 Transcript_68716/m.173724 type:complete len:220 (+) Transcript_68716:597-1256(+)
MLAKREVTHSHHPHVDGKGDAEGNDDGSVETPRRSSPHLNVELGSVVVRDECSRERAKEHKGGDAEAEEVGPICIPPRHALRLRDDLVILAFRRIGPIGEAELHEGDNEDLASHTDYGRVRQDGQVPLQAQREQNDKHDDYEHRVMVGEETCEPKTPQDRGVGLPYDHGVAHASEGRLQHQNHGHELRQVRPRHNLARFLVVFGVRRMAHTAHGGEGVA